jgi:hypothetical protein
VYETEYISIANKRADDVDNAMYKEFRGGLSESLSSCTS